MIIVREYRGHIRNWRQLCQELAIDSSLDRRSREIEILTKGYQLWGAELLQKLHGMYAFALWDAAKEQLFCARDAFGATPFYYYMTEKQQLLYGTSIRQVMAQEGFQKELNEKLLQLYLSLTYVAGEETFFRGVKKLLPGRYMLWKDGKVEIVRYWKPEFTIDREKTVEEWAEEIHTTLQSIMTEVKEEEEYAESFLSGGVDSSYVLAVSDAPVANSCGYEEERFDESVLAEKTAQLLGRQLRRCIITPEQYFSVIPYVMYNMEQPLGDASAIAFALGCREVAKHTKLCYSGEGSDEFFGGYNMYRNAERYGENLKTFFVGNTNIMKEEEKQRLLKHYEEGVLPINLAKELYEEMEGMDPLSKMLSIDTQIWLEGDILLNVDRMSTAAGLEVRMPLLDRRMFAVASRMPAECKVTEEQNKVAFRKAAEHVLPEEIAQRKKLGFVVPIRIWLADERYNQDVQAKLRSEAAEKFFNTEELSAVWKEYIDGNSDLWRKIWTIYAFLVWYEQYFEKQ